MTSEEPAEPEEQWVEATRVAPAVATAKEIDSGKDLARNMIRGDGAPRQLPSSDG